MRMAIPNKGRLSEPSISLLRDAGIGVVEGEARQLFAQTLDPELELVFVRAQDIPDLVARGAVDLGITGYDLVLESGADVTELLDLKFGSARLVVAVPENSSIRSLDDLKGKVRVATEFPQVAGRYFRKKNVDVELVKVSGAVEITPFMGIADLVVDLSSTGTTLRAQGLRVIDTLFETSARLITNKTALKREKISEVTTALESVVRARGKRLILMNVPEKNLQAVKRIVPGMTGPTVSKVESSEPMLAVQAVVESTKIYEVVGKLKRAGARDILVMPLERVLL